jgi:hypothetical protein
MGPKNWTTMKVGTENGIAAFIFNLFLTATFLSFCWVLPAANLTPKLWSVADVLKLPLIPNSF